jgi:AraC-like DNA-binding protein
MAIVGKYPAQLGAGHSAICLALPAHEAEFSLAGDLCLARRELERLGEDQSAVALPALAFAPRWASGSMVRANVARVVRVDAASRRMLRARDKVDRSYDKPLDVAALARVALTSEAHFIRTFKDTFGETPHRYLQRRRLERAMALLRETERPVTEICLDVGFTSLGSFSRTFTHVIGMSPTAYREAWRTGAGTAGYVPTCVVMSWTRPRGEPRDSSFGEANRDGPP